MKKNFLFLFALTLCISAVSVSAQDEKRPIEITIGTLKTDLKQSAIGYGVSYLKSLDSLWEKQDFLISRDRSLFLVTPDLNIQSGNNDAFSSISAKMTGLIMCFDTILIDSVVTPNTAKTFHTFPISLGVETNNKFNILNAIAEFGWVPWYQTTQRRSTPDFLKQTKFGLFIQTGYKFAIDSTGNANVGGEIDQSKEQADNAILRAKGSFGVKTKALKFSILEVGLVGSADGWYDFLNNEIYYRIDGRLRFYLNHNHDRYFDFKYEKGSGAPNFNQGDQYGMGLTVTF